MRIWMAVALVSLLSLSACDGSSAGGTTTPDPGTGSGTSPGTMSARIEGALWTAAGVIATRPADSSGIATGTLAVSGTGPLANQTVNITFAVPPAIGIYTLGPLTASGTSPNAALNIAATGAKWTATSVTGSGTITVLSFTLTRATGNFAFTLTPIGTTPAIGTRVVTEGVFDVTF